MSDWALDYVLHVLQAKDWSMNRLAQESGVAASTINRPLRDKNWPHRLKPDTIAKIHAATGIDPLPFVPPGEIYGVGASRSGRGLAEEQTPLRILMDGKRNSLSILIDGPVVRINGTLDREGIQKLRERLDHLAALLDD